MSSAEARPKTCGPDISLIMPCFNEEQVVGYTIPKLSAAFRQAGHRLELIAVDNGSSDRTGEIIRELAAKDPSVVPHRVEINEGYGNGILNSVSRCGSPWVGIISADGQVDAEGRRSPVRIGFGDGRQSAREGSPPFPNGWIATQDYFDLL